MPNRVAKVSFEAMKEMAKRHTNTYATHTHTRTYTYASHTHMPHSYTCHTRTARQTDEARGSRGATICLLCLTRRSNCWNLPLLSCSAAPLPLLRFVTCFTFYHSSTPCTVPNLLPFAYFLLVCCCCSCCCCVPHQYLAPTISATPTQRVYITSDYITSIHTICIYTYT